MRVKLTEYGKELIAKDENPYPYTIDEDGYSKFQMWVLMRLFGQHCYIGSTELLFETEIKLVLE